MKPLNRSGYLIVFLTLLVTQTVTAATPKGRKPPKPKMLYSSTNHFPSVVPQIGDDVLCGSFGRGKVIEIRSSSSPEAAPAAVVETAPTTNPLVV